MTIKSFKLVTGEEIIATFNKRNATDQYIISKPRAIGLQQVGPNQVGVGIMPWMVSISDTATVNLTITHIVAMVDENDIPKQLVDRYLQETSSIQLATAETSSILGINK